MELIYKLKQIKRSGWLVNDINDCESIADHMYGMQILAMTYFEQANQEHKINKEHIYEMIACHDVVECVSGDIINHELLPIEQKKMKAEKELKSIKYLQEQLDQHEYKQLSETLIQNYLEFENEQTYEAKFVKDLDKLDMLLQAKIYSKEKQKDLNQFFSNCSYPKYFKCLIEARKQVEKDLQL